MKELEHFFIGESYGGNQDWFTDWWMNRGGCAAVTACDCCIVLARQRGLRALYPFDADRVTQQDFLAFGGMMRPFLHPRPTGLNKTGLFMDGFREYLSSRAETRLTMRAVEGTADVAAAEREIRAAIDRGFPVPYLMLLHTDKALEDYNWHWFLLNGYDGEGETFRVKAVTYGEAQWLDFPHLWDTGHGHKGGFVVFSLSPPAEKQDDKGGVFMNCDVIRMDENTWRIEDQGVRFFLLTGSEQALLIDSGRTVRNAREIAGELTPLPLSLLNTHTDMDHTGSNGEFEEMYMHPAEEAYYRRRGGTGTIRPIREGDTLDLGGRKLEIIELPGHTAGSIAVLDVERRALISGDPVQDGRVFMFGDHRNALDYIASLERLETFRDRFDELWPSHGTIPLSPEWIGKLHDAAERLLRGELTGRSVEVHGQNVFQYDLGFASFLFDR